MATVHIEVYSPFQENTYLVYDETKEAVIIDPGCYDERDNEHFSSIIKQRELKIKRLLNTHCHIDHVFGNHYVHSTYNLLPEIHEEDLPTLNYMTPGASSMYGVKYTTSPQPKKFLTEGEIISFGNTKLEVLFTPGHAPGHVVFVCHQDKFIINGDVLFYGSIGRTDFPGCSHKKLIESIKTKLFTLPEDYTVYTGHGPKTSIGFEKKNNPFLN